MIIMKFRMILIVMLSLLLVAGCSNRGWYEGMKNRERVLCNQVPASDYEDCMRQAEGNYNEYEKQREEVKNEQKE